MIRVLSKLMFLSLMASLGVHLGYKELEKKVIQPPWFSVEERTESQHIEGLEALVAGLDEQALQQVSKDTRIILQRNLFQTGATPPVAPQVVPKQEVQPVVEAPVPTSLNLTLVGTAVGTQGNSRAIIVDPQKRGEQMLVQVGDGIQGAIVQAIEWDKVVLDVSGKKEILEMPKAQDSPPPAATARVQAVRSPRTVPIPPPPPRQTLPDEVLQPDTQTRRPRPPPLRPQRRIDLPAAEPSPELPPDLSLPELEAGPGPADEILLPPM